jgi:hypothetical protein
VSSTARPQNGGDGGPIQHTGSLKILRHNASFKEQGSGGHSFHPNLFSAHGSEHSRVPGADDEEAKVGRELHEYVWLQRDSLGGMLSCVKGQGGTVSGVKGLCSQVDKRQGRAFSVSEIDQEDVLTRLDGDNARPFHGID